MSLPASPIREFVARGPLQHVVADAAVQNIDGGVAGERVVQVRAGQILNIDQAVDPGADGVLRRGGGDADGHPGRRIGIAGRVAAGGTAVQGVVAGAADQGVVADPADQGVVADAAVQHVVAGPAVQDIGNAIAGEGVVEIRAGQILRN